MRSTGARPIVPAGRALAALSTREGGGRGGRGSAQIGDLSRSIERETAALAWLDAYQPQRIPAAQWVQVRSFVLEIARILVTDHGASGSLRTQVRALTRLSLYALGAGTPLTLRAVLDPYTIERYADSERQAVSTGTYRSTLRHLGRLLNPAAPWETPTARAYRTLALPYAPTELDAIWRQIQTNPGARRRGGQALFLLGLGAGLDGRWATRVRGADVAEIDDQLVIMLADRQVPVLTAYRDKLRRLVDETADDALLIGGQVTRCNAANEINRRLRLAPSGPQLNCGRLRSTWLATHLTLGTRLPELMRAAGIRSATSLSDLVPFVHPLSADPEREDRLTRVMLHGSPR